MEGGRPGTLAVLITMSFCVPLNQVVWYKVPPWMVVLQGRVTFSPSLTVTFGRTLSTTARKNCECKIKIWKQILDFRDSGILVNLQLE